MTEAADGEQHGQGVEVGWGCGDWVWLLEPATNGTTEEMVEVAAADVLAQGDPDTDAYDDLLERYPGAQIRNFDDAPGVSEMDALIAYLQMLGTTVDFSTFTPAASR